MSSMLGTLASIVAPIEVTRIKVPRLSKTGGPRDLA